MTDLMQPIVETAVPEAGPRSRRSRSKSGSRLIIIGLILVVVSVLVSLLGPLLAPYTPTEIVGKPYQVPSPEAIFGTDVVGRDVLTRVLFGGASLLALSFIAAAVGTLVGTFVGLTTGYYRGPYATGMLTLMDVLFAFPTIVLALLIVSVGGPNPVLIALAVALSHVPQVARVIWGAARTLSSREHVMWSQAVGIRSWRIITRDLLPLVVSPITVEFGLRMMWSIGAIAGLSFIGYGIQPPAADWGLMVSENKSGLVVQPLAVIVPILLIAVLTLGCYLASEGFARRLGRTGGKRG